MAQQIFDQYAPLAKVSASETIPVVAAIAQTRDGKDELLLGNVPFVPGPGGLYVPVSASNRLPVEATLSGSYVTPGTDGDDVLRTKTQELAYKSLDFDSQQTITVTAGSAVLESTVHSVNGFGKVGILIREVSGLQHQFRFRVQWSSQSTAPNDRRFHSEPVPQTHASGAVAVTETYSQYMRGEIHNVDVVDHTYHIHYMLRAS